MHLQPQPPSLRPFLYWGGLERGRGHNVDEKVYVSGRCARGVVCICVRIVCIKLFFVGGGQLGGLEGVEGWVEIEDERKCVHKLMGAKTYM
jgi:hypothetical protein